MISFVKMVKMIRMEFMMKNLSVMAKIAGIILCVSGFSAHVLGVSDETPEIRYQRTQKLLEKGHKSSRETQNALRWIDGGLNKLPFNKQNGLYEARYNCPTYNKVLYDRAIVRSEGKKTPQYIPRCSFFGLVTGIVTSAQQVRLKERIGVSVGVGVGVMGFMYAAFRWRDRIPQS
jgi:hypothetical protein